MKKGLLASAAVITSVISCVAAVAGRVHAIQEKEAPVDEPYVQVTSITVEPTTIHKDSRPQRATIFVQIKLGGAAPPASTVRVDIGTYSSHPAENGVSYVKQSKTVPIREGLTVVEFTAEVNPHTVTGKVVIAADIREVSKGVNIKPPDSYENYRAELFTTVP